ncbi:MAG: uracil-DNA glycosylase, partial [Sutterella sp.]|nr:uracil-DNA glycosylase [Sutterella sp.]
LVRELREPLQSPRPTQGAAALKEQSGARPGPVLRAQAPAEGGAPLQTAHMGMPESLAEQIRAAGWDELKALANACSLCSMASSRQHVVFSDGDPGPGLVIVGEAPGAEEDLQGLPFVGKSGQLLTSMLESLNIVRRKDAVILNVLKCRPPQNRNPQPEEISCCGHYLERQLEILAPRVLLLAGRFAVGSLLKLEGNFSIGRQRGRIHQVMIGGRTVPAVVTYHPSYLLRSPLEKAKSWDDLLLLKSAMRDAGILPPEKEKRWN